MSDIIGGASEFYRLRVMHMDESDAPDLDWRDDILYRQAPAERAEEYDVWRVEAVDLDDDTCVMVLATFASDEEARSCLQVAGEDLLVMTKSEFERAYFTDGAGSAEASSA